LFGSLESREAEGISFPPGVTDEIYEAITNFSVLQIETLYGNQEMCSLGIGLFIQEILRNDKRNPQEGGRDRTTKHKNKCKNKKRQNQTNGTKRKEHITTQQNETK